VSAGYGEVQPGIKIQLESKIEGLLSGETYMMGVSAWQSDILANYSHFEITNIEPHGHGYEATAQVYFPDKVENLYLRTDSSAEEITELSMGFPLPGTSPDDLPKEEPVDPPRRTSKPGKGTGEKQEPAGPSA
jgi:hypothetical protein